MKVDLKATDIGAEVVFMYSDMELLNARLSPLDIEFLNRNIDSGSSSAKLLCYAKIARAIETTQ
jgi:hypothetical protein